MLSRRSDEHPRHGRDGLGSRAIKAQRGSVAATTIGKEAHRSKGRTGFHDRRDYLVPTVTYLTSKEV